MELRESWEKGHAIRFMLQLTALSLLVLSVLETRENATPEPNRALNLPPPPTDAVSVQYLNRRYVDETEIVYYTLPNRSRK
jgi:hypothetical protein